MQTNLFLIDTLSNAWQVLDVAFSIAKVIKSHTKDLVLLNLSMTHLATQWTLKIRQKSREDQRFQDLS